MADFARVVDAGPGYTVVVDADGNQYTLKGARNWRNNNPGNIEYGPFARKMGAIGSDGRFAVFPSYDAGRSAKEALLFSSPRYADKTIAGAISRYAPDNENDTQAYTNAVVRAIGAKGTTKLSDLTPQQRRAMLDAMEGVEGFRVGRTFDASGAPVPPMNIPQVATALDTVPASVMPASLSDGLQQRRAATLPTYNITPVPSRRSDKNIDNRKEQATVMGGINLPLQNALMPPQPPMKPAAGGYKTAGKEFLSDQRFASGMADKTAPGTPRVASLGPMPPLPMPRPQSPVTAMPNTVAPGLITETFATLGFERDSGGVKVADLYKGLLPIAPLAPRPVPGQSYAGQDRAMPQMPPAPLPMPRSMRPADPGLNGNPAFQFGTPGLPAGLPAQVPPTRALPPMPRPRPMMPPMVTVSGAAPRAMPPMPLPRPMGMPVQQFQAQGLSPQQAYAAANQAAQERAIANSRDPERNAARAALAARWGFD